MAFLIWTGFSAWLLFRLRARKRRYRESEKALAEVSAQSEQLRQENNRYNYDIIALYEFLGNMASCRSTNASYQVFIDSIQQSIAPDVSAVFIKDNENGDDFYWLAAQHGLNDFNVIQSRLTAANGMIRWAAVHTREVQVEDADTDGRFPELREPPCAPHFKAAIALPLIHQRAVLGVFIIGRESGGFSMEDLRLLFIIANESALYLQNLRLYEEVADLAITDGSTGLYNHRYFFEQLDLQLAEAVKYGFTVSLMMIDIDKFKELNDQYGHLTGDKILRNVAEIIRDEVGSNHLAARYGGEEFAAVLADMDLSSAVEMGERIRETVEKRQFLSLDDRKVHLTVSIGVATFPQHIKDSTNALTDLIAVADLQLVSFAKKGGRNQVCFPGRLSN